MDNQQYLDLWHTFELALENMADKRVKQFQKALESARYDLKNTISDPDTWKRQRLNSLINQIDQIQKELNKRIIDIGPASGDIADLVQSHLLGSLKAIVPNVNVELSLGILNTDVLYKFSQASLNQVTSIQAVQFNTVRSILFSKVGVEGQSSATVARYLAGPAGIIAKKYGYIENVVRTETSTIYNEQSLNGIEYINEKHDLALNKRIVETIDDKRNHPISQVLNGQVQAVDKNFKASVSEVAKVARKLKKSISKDGTVGGIFWGVKDGFYVGRRLPAHFMERGIVVPTIQEVNIE